MPGDPTLIRHGQVVVIDGPAGAGKTTIARNVAERLGLPLLDTGAIYRSLALVAVRREMPWTDGAGLATLCVGLPIRFENAGPGALPGAPQRVLLAGEDVTTAIRTPDISRGASIVSAHPPVRAALLGLQRSLGTAGCVAEGRDMGTVVFPDAPHKFFVTASLEVRAKRRRDEWIAQGEPGVPTLEEVVADVKERDLRDSTRASAPLSQAQDAVLVDTSRMPPEAVIDHILALIDAG